MSRLPTSIQFAKEVPSGRSTSVRAQLDTATGGGAIGRALQGLGAVLSDIGFAELQRTQEASDAVELSTLKLKVRDIRIDGLVSSKNAANKEGILEVATNTKTLVDAVASENTRVNTALTVFKNNTRAGFNGSIAKEILDNTRRAVIDGAQINMQKFLEEGDLPGAASQLVHLRKFDVISQQVLEQRVKELPNAALLAQAGVIAGTDPDAALKLLGKIKKPTGEQARQRDSLVGHANSIKNRQNSALKEVQDKQRLALYESAYIRNEPLTFEGIKDNAPDLPVKEQIQFFENWKKAQEQKLQRGVSLIEEGDSTIKAKIQSSIDRNPELWTEDSIYRATREWPGKNGKLQNSRVLGTKHAPGLISRLRSNRKAELGPTAARAQRTLSKMYSAGVFGDKDDSDTADTFNRLDRNLQVFIGSNPTDIELDAFFQQLITGDVRKFRIFSPNLGANELPGFEDRPLEIDIRSKEFEISFGDVIFVGGKRFQIVGRKEGVPQLEPR